MRTAVVLPAPFGPRTPSTVPFGTDRSIPRSARTSPNDLVRPSTRIAGPELICDTQPPEQAGSPPASGARKLPAALPCLRTNIAPRSFPTVLTAWDILPIRRTAHQKLIAPVPALQRRADRARAPAKACPVD